MEISEEILKKYSGKYIDDEDNTSITNLTLGKNALIFNSTNNPWDLPFYPDSEATFFSKAPRMDIRFEFKEDNNVLKLIFLQNGKKIGESTKK